MAAALCLLCSASLSAQTLKVGYVDSQKIFEGLPEAQAALKQLDKQLGVWRDSLDVMVKSAQEQYETYQAQQGTMSEPTKQARQQELAKLGNEIQEYRQKKFGQDGEGAALRQKMLAPLQEKVLKVIEEVSKEEKISFMFDKVSEVPIILHADPKFDYTFKVLDRIKRGN